VPISCFRRLGCLGATILHFREKTNQRARRRKPRFRLVPQ
jgi:hypothetical protein